MRVRPTVSVALATYNGERFLQAQLDSLAAQTLQPSELVVGDDCSSDATVEILEAFAAKAPFPVRIHRNPARLDFGDNFLSTALRCTGDYVAFCDQDDVWLPNKLEATLGAMEAHGATLCGHDALIVDETLTKTGYLSAGERAGPLAPLTVKPWGVFFGFTLMFRRDLLALAPLSDRPPDQFRPGKQLAHDRWVYFLGSALGPTVYLQDPLALYRQHGSNTFGVSANGGMTLGLLRARVKIAAAEQALQEASARQKAQVMANIAQETDGQTAALARAAAIYWTRMAGIYARRTQVAARGGLGGRVGAIAQLMASGGYAPPARGGLSLRALAKDLVVAFAPRGDEPPSSLGRPASGA